MDEENTNGLDIPPFGQYIWLYLINRAAVEVRREVVGGWAKKFQLRI